MKYASITERLAGLGGAKWEIHARARKMKAAGTPVLEFTIGEPDAPCPPELIETAARSMASGRTGYSNGRGEPGLLRALAARYSTRRGRHFGPEQVMCFPGTQTTLFAVLMALAQGLLSAHQQERRGRIRVFEAVIVGVALLLQATLPNFWGKGIDILMRLALITHLCVLFWVLALPQRRSSSLWIPFMVLPIMIMQQQIRGEEQERNNERMRACHAVAMRVIPGGSVAIVSFDWLGSHLPELAFADRNVLNLSNYEFINPHFPLRWSDSTMTARAAAPEHPLDVLEPWSNVPGTRLIVADHILVIGPPQDDAQRQALDLLRTSLRGTHPEEEGDGNYRLYSRANGQFNSETRISKASIGTARSVPFQK